MTDNIAREEPATGGPVVGVVIPMYRVEAFVAEALESVRRQTFGGWECVVVDDGSPDGSAQRARAVVDTDPRMRLVRQPNRGVSAARNAGLALLSPSVEFVAFLDPDDAWSDDALERLVTALRADPSAAGAWGLAEYIDEDGRPDEPGLHPSRQRDRRRVVARRLESVAATEPLTFEEALVVSPLYPSAVALHRRILITEVGEFDPALDQIQDWDLYLRVLRRGHYVPLDVTIAAYRRHGGQVTRNVARGVVRQDEVRRRAWLAPENSPAQRQAAVRAWRQVHARRTARSAQRLLAAVGRGGWRDVPPLVGGTFVLAAQNLRPGPPRTTLRQVRWSRRTV